MQHQETFEKIKKALKPGEQVEIAKRTGFSLTWVNQILNLKRGATNEEAQRAVIDAALEVIKKRQIKEAELSKKYAEKTSALLG